MTRAAGVNSTVQAPAKAWPRWLLAAALLVGGAAAVSLWTGFIELAAASDAADAVWRSREATRIREAMLAGMFLNYKFYGIVAVILLLERMFPVERGQRTLHPSLAHDGVWLLWHVVMEICIVYLFTGFLKVVYDRYLAFLTIDAIARWPAWAGFAIAVLVSDFLNWLSHLIRHKIPVLWHFHAVHHSQRRMNVFTELRYHVGEYFVVEAIRFVPMFMLGVSFEHVVWFGMFQRWYGRLYHASIRTGFGPLRYVLVTPQSHRVHHSYAVHHWDKNFGVIFSIWDRIFGTHYEAQKDEYPPTGIPDQSFPHERETTGRSLLLTPLAQMWYPFRAMWSPKANPDGAAAEPDATPACVAQVAGAFGGGGAQRLALNLARGLRDAGVGSVCFALRDAGGVPEAVRGGVEIVDLRCEGGAIATLRGMLRLRREIARRGVDVLHVHMPKALLFCALATRGMDRPPRLFFTYHDSKDWLFQDRGWRLALTRWAVRQCEAVYGPSRAVAARLAEALGPSIRTGVFRNGVPEAGETARAGNREPVILWMGRFRPFKDPQILVRAAATLRAGGLKFRVVLAGAPDLSHYDAYFRQTQQLVADLGLSDAVEMPGWIDDPAPLLRAADIGVQTSHAEALSLTLLEQMTAGLAIVATDVGDTARAIADGETGLLVPPRDQRALTDALRRLLTDAALRRELGAAARRRAASEFSCRRMAEDARREYGGTTAPPRPESLQTAGVA